MATQAERSAGTRARVLEAAAACLVERGYFGTSTAAVCRRAGATRGAQLHHYPTKAALLGAAVEHVMAQRHAELRAAAAAARNLDGVLAALWAAYAGPASVAWLELVVAARTDAALLAVVRGVKARFEREAEVTLRGLFPGVPAARAAACARLVMAAFDGLALGHGVDGREDLTRAALAELRRLLAPWRARRPRAPRAAGRGSS